MSGINIQCQMDHSARMIAELRGPAGYPKTKVLLRPPLQRIQSLWERGRFYERAMLDYVYVHFSGGTFVDVGSNLGNHTLFFAMYCSPDLVISVEPVVGYLRHQQRNLTLNKLGSDRVVTHNVAVSDAPGTGKMIKGESNPSPRARWSWHRGMHELKEGDGKTVVTTLDLLLGDVSDVALIKLDIEGSELKALAGAAELLTREQPVLFLEATPESRHKNYAKFLKQFGYDSGKRIYPKIFEFRMRK